MAAITHAMATAVTQSQAVSDRRLRFFLPPERRVIRPRPPEATPGDVRARRKRRGRALTNAANLTQTRRPARPLSRARLVRARSRLGARSARRVRRLTSVRVNTRNRVATHAPRVDDAGGTAGASHRGRSGAQPAPVHSWTFACVPCGKGCSETFATGEVRSVAGWLVILLIVLLVFALFGGVGYYRR